MKNQTSKSKKKKIETGFSFSNESIPLNIKDIDLFNLLGYAQRGMAFETEKATKEHYEGLIDILIEALPSNDAKECLKANWNWEIPKQKTPVLPSPEPKPMIGGVQVLLSRNSNNVTTKIDLPAGASDKDYREALTRMLELAQEGLDKRDEMNDDFDLFDRLRSEFVFLANREKAFLAIRQAGQPLNQWQAEALERYSQIKVLLETIKSRFDWAERISNEGLTEDTDEGDYEDEDENEE